MKAKKEDLEYLVRHNDSNDESVIVLSLAYETSYMPFITKRVNRINCDLKTAATILKFSCMVYVHKYTDLYWLACGLRVAHDN
jgi:hypothetical protein